MKFIVAGSFAVSLFFMGTINAEANLSDNSITAYKYHLYDIAI